jgi:hypothetical protein
MSFHGNPIGNPNAVLRSPNALNQSSSIEKVIESLKVVEDEYSKQKMDFINFHRNMLRIKERIDKLLETTNVVRPGVTFEENLIE